jgi:SEC-C motif-containing protein
MTLCPCGTGKQFSECCEPYLKGEKNPSTAEALMRSRYSAFATAAVAYLRETLAPEKRGDFDEKSMKKWAGESQWLGLEIVKTEKGQPSDTTGTVEFIARYKGEGGEIKHHEIAQFKKQASGWRYWDGEIVGAKPFIRPEPKVGRNDPCPCGSGKKYKKCCGKNEVGEE